MHKKPGRQTIWSPFWMLSPVFFLRNDLAGRKTRSYDGSCCFREEQSIRCKDIYMMSLWKTCFSAWDRVKETVETKANAMCFLSCAIAACHRDQTSDSPHRKYKTHWRWNGVSRNGGREIEHDRATEGAALKFIMPVLPQKSGEGLWKWGEDEDLFPLMLWTQLKSCIDLKDNVTGPVNIHKYLRWERWVGLSAWKTLW